MSGSTIVLVVALAGLAAMLVGGRLLASTARPARGLTGVVAFLLAPYLLLLPLVGLLASGIGRALSGLRPSRRVSQGPGAPVA